MNVEVKHGSMSISLDRKPSPERLRQIIEDCATYWPHNTVIDFVSVQVNSDLWTITLAWSVS